MITKTGMGLLAFAAVGALAGCTETIDSKNLRTGGIAATIEATAARADKTEIIATLRAGGDESNTYVDLGSGDGIFAESDGKRVEMNAESTGVYTASFPTGAAETEFKVDLQRDVDDDAPENVGTLPAPFELAALPTEPVKRADPVTITWEPSGTGDTMAIHVDGSCIFAKNIDVPGDPGTFTLDSDDLDPTSSGKTESCDVKVELTRSRGGSTDSALDAESSFVLRQSRSTKFTSAP